VTTSEAEGARPIIRPYESVWPRIHPEAWVAPGAVVVGDVEVGPGSSIWYGAVVRGDVHFVRIGARTNLQDLSVVHVTRGLFSCEIGDEVTVGHRATVHGCRVGDGALIGVGATVLDGAEVGEGALVGAGAVVTPGTKVEPEMVVLGTPARPTRRLTDEERERHRAQALAYVETARMHAEAMSRP
jgi:carbonic anhydrase/acetyltransferase-like protein (isoleucine patch superfamily)